MDFTTDTRDDLKLTLPEGWLHIRNSNIELITCLVAESETEEDASRLFEDLQTRFRGCLDA